MENAFIFFVIAAIVIGTVVSSISKMTTAKKTQNTQNQSRPSAPNASRGVSLASENKDDFRTEADKVSQNKEKDYVIKHNMPSSLGSPKNEQTHSHPASQRNVRVEKAYVESSIDKYLSEGCENHYYDRFVAISEDSNTEKPLTELEKIIVFGEIINNPGHKKYGR